MVGRRWEGDHKAATELRAEDRAVYEETLNDYTESIDALGRAITVLKAKLADVPG